ncbi:MAG TPA: glycosyltransferase family 4 protein [Chryseosolibacter sp.]
MGSKILFLVPYPLHESPSQRFRFEQYFDILVKAGHHYDVQPFLNSQNWQLFFKPGQNLIKALALLSGFFKRFVSVVRAVHYDFVFIHREATPAGPPIIEWLLARVLRKKIIYDFDDAIWMTDRSSEPTLLRAIKWRSKVSSICKWSHKVSCGNQYLQRYALQFNGNAVIIPTTIDTTNHHNPALYPSTHEEKTITIGWTGSHSTLKYLKEIEGALSKVLKQNPTVRVSIIADRKPVVNFPFVFMPWSAATEIEDLLTFDIGVMPLPDDEWSKGKCGFKILQYMALKVPAVASPVGVNQQIIDDGKSGFLCASETEWIGRLSQLIVDPNLRKALALAGYRQVINNYSVQSNAGNFLKLFE